MIYLIRKIKQKASQYIELFKWCKFPITLINGFSWKVNYNIYICSDGAH